MPKLLLLAFFFVMSVAAFTAGDAAASPLDGTAAAPGYQNQDMKPFSTLAKVLKSTGKTGDTAFGSSKKSSSLKSSSASKKSKKSARLAGKSHNKSSFLKSKSYKKLAQHKNGSSKKLTSNKSKTRAR